MWRPRIRRSWPMIETLCMYREKILPPHPENCLRWELCMQYIPHVCGKYWLHQKTSFRCWPWTHRQGERLWWTKSLKRLSPVLQIVWSAPLSWQGLPIWNITSLVPSSSLLSSIQKLSPFMLNVMLENWREMGSKTAHSHLVLKQSQCVMG